MARKPISYPVDYQNDRAIRREHRAGVVIVLALLSLCLLAVVVGGIVAATQRENIQNALGPVLGEKGFCPEPFDPQPGWPGAPFDPNEKTPPVPPHTEDPFFPVPSATPSPSAQAEPTDRPVPTKEAALDPNFMDDAAQPFETVFSDIPDVVDAVAPGVVGVINLQRREGLRHGRLVEWGSGSGFVITTDGYILTNQHVIEGAEKITVRMHDGEEYAAMLIGADKTSDTAVLKIDAEGLTALPKGDSDALRVGSFVLAIGDPVDSSLGGSVTFGIISATSRQVTIEGFTNDYLQTDAAINLGNSGGPLIDMHGNVIGMNSAKSVTAGYDSLGNAIAAEGIGFALPINRVWEIATQLISTGTVPRPGIGITIRQYNADYAEEGVELRPYVDSVVEGGPADLAGMQVKDVILAVDGTPVSDHLEVVQYIREHTKIGQKITFSVERGDQTLDIEVVVGDLNKMS